MANVQVKESTMYRIADAIRQKLSSSDTYKPSEMGDAIESIEDPQENDFKKAGKIFTTALSSNPFTITALDQNPERQLREEAFRYTGSTNYTNILKKLTGITFPAVGLLPPTSLSYFFYDLPEITTIDLVGLDISEITSMLSMCYDCRKLTSFKFGSVENNVVSNINYLFRNCQKLSSIDQGNVDISNIESAYSAFMNCYSLPGISFINNKTYPNLVDVQYMFSGCISLDNVVLEGINLTSSEKIKFYDFFENCNSLKTVTIKDVTIPNSSEINIDNLFQSSSSGIPLKTLTLNNVVIEGKLYHPSSYTYLQNLISVDFINTKFLNNNNELNYIFGMYNGNTKLKTVNFDGSEIHGNIYRFFSGCTLLTSVNFTNTKLKVYRAREMFYGCSSLVSIDFGDSLDIETSSPAVLLKMFGECSSLQSVNFGTGKLICRYNDHNIANEMFYKCYALTTVDFSGIELFIGDAYEMFKGASALTTILFGEGVIINEGQYMFQNCRSLTTVDFSNVQVNNAQYLFYEATGLTTVTLKDGNIFDSAYRMFDGCSSLINVNFNNNTIKDSARFMFIDCTSLVTIDLSNVTFSDLAKDNQSTEDMFNGCTSLQSVILPVSFTEFHLQEYQYCKIFKNCTSLQSLTLLSPTPPTFYGNAGYSYLFSTGVRGGYNEGMKIFVPQGCGQVYKEDSKWSLYADIIYELS